MERTMRAIAAVLFLQTLLLSQEAKEPQEVLYLAAVVTSEDQIQIIAARRGKGIPRVRPPEKGQAFSVDLLDVAGKSLARVPFTVDLSRGPSAVTLAIPHPTELKALVILREGKELARMTRSANAPTAAFSEVKVDAKRISFTLDLSDKDGEVINYDLMLEADGSRNLLHSGLYDSKKEDYADQVGGILDRTGKTFTIDRSALGGGKKSLLRAIVTDGLNSVEVASAEFNLGDVSVHLDVGWNVRGSLPDRLPEISNGRFEIRATRTAAGVVSSLAGKSTITSSLDGVVPDEAFYLSPGAHQITVAFVEGKEAPVLRSFRVVVDLEPAEWRQVEIPAALQPTPEKAREIEALLEQLGGDLAAEREKAQRRLQDLGPMAIPQVSRALESTDAEVRGRALALFETLIAHWEGRWACVPSPSRRAKELVAKLRTTSTPPGPVWSNAIAGLLKRYPDEDGFWAELLGCKDLLHLRRDLAMGLGPARYSRAWKRWHETVKDTVVEGLPAEIASVSAPRFGGVLLEDTKFTVSFSLPLAPDKLEGWAAEALIDGAGIERLEYLKHSAWRQGNTSQRTVSFFAPPLPAGEHRVALYLYPLEKGIPTRIHKAAEQSFTIPKSAPR